MAVSLCGVSAFLSMRHAVMCYKRSDTEPQPLPEYEILFCMCRSSQGGRLLGGKGSKPCSRTHQQAGLLPLQEIEGKLSAAERWTPNLPPWF